MRDLLRGLGSVQLAVLHGFSSESCFWSLGVGWEALFFFFLPCSFIYVFILEIWTRVYLFGLVWFGLVR